MISVLIYSSIHNDRPFHICLVWSFFGFNHHKPWCADCQDVRSEIQRHRLIAWWWGVVFSFTFSNKHPYWTHISTDIKKLVLWLAIIHGYKYKKIWEILGISERCIKHICALHRHIGDVVCKRTVNGCPHSSMDLRHQYACHIITLLLPHLTTPCSFLKVALNDSLTCLYQSCRINLRKLVE